MFTGIVEATGALAEVKPVSGGFRIRIETELASALAPGASLGVGFSSNLSGFSCNNETDLPLGETLIFVVDLIDVR